MKGIHGVYDVFHQGYPGGNFCLGDVLDKTSLSGLVLLAHGLAEFRIGLQPRLKQRFVSIARVQIFHLRVLTWEIASSCFLTSSLIPIYLYNYRLSHGNLRFQRPKAPDSHAVPTTSMLSQQLPLQHIYIYSVYPPPRMPVTNEGL